MCQGGGGYSAHRPPPLGPPLVMDITSILNILNLLLFSQKINYVAAYKGFHHREGCGVHNQGLCHIEGFGGLDSGPSQEFGWWVRTQPPQCS